MPAMAPKWKACHCCGLVVELPEVPQGHRARCPRCRTTVHDPGAVRPSLVRTRALASAGLVLYPLAISLPVMRVERFGQANEASVWTGSLSLLREGEILVGLVVLVCSIVLPLMKLVGLLLVTSAGAGLSRARRALVYRLIEWTGRWGMLDVLLIALVVAWLKVGDLLQVTPGPGAITFTACVLLSLGASASFDPHALWEDEEPSGGSVADGVRSPRA